MDLSILGVDLRNATLIKLWEHPWVIDGARDRAATRFRQLKSPQGVRPIVYPPFLIGHDEDLFHRNKAKIKQS